MEHAWVLELDLKDPFVLLICRSRMQGSILIQQIHSAPQSLSATVDW